MLIKNKIISLWLSVVCFAIIFMIFIGGLTRLTDSGLSITEWKPVSGIIPPLDQKSWDVEFNKYKQSPEYIKYNFDMSLKEFKSIYLLEFYHRIAGRVTGLIYLIPLIFFLLKGIISLKESRVYFFALFLFVSQGIVGWYMVKSGLISNPHVSHYRLAGHLMLAVFLYITLFWQLMKNVFEPILFPVGQSIRLQRNLCLASIILLLVQMMLGAFVAGLDAGLVYNSFPLMGGNFIPDEVVNLGISIRSFSDPVFVQFIHRLFAYILFIVIIAYCFFAMRLDIKKISRLVLYIIIALIIQMLAGIFTLLYMIPIPIALGHQLGAIVLLSFLLWSYFLFVSLE